MDEYKLSVSKWHSLLHTDHRSDFLIPLITFLRPAEMLDKCEEVVEPQDVQMLSYIKIAVPNLGQFAIRWREEEEVEKDKE